MKKLKKIKNPTDKIFGKNLKNVINHNVNLNGPHFKNSGKIDTTKTIKNK